MTRCTGEPVSWLRLERYGLGELSGAERESIASHLQACPACSACWARIEEERARALPPLAAEVVALGGSSGTPRALPGPKRTSLGRWVWASGLAAAACAVLVVWRAGPEASGGDVPAPRQLTKGGELSLELVRLGRDGRIWEATHYHPDDRFKILLTCPPAWRVAAEVVIYQGRRAYYPLAPLQLEACGNRRPVEGAFRIDGEDEVHVCVATSPASTPLDRATLGDTVASLPEHSVCQTLARDASD